MFLLCDSDLLVMAWALVRGDGGTFEAKVLAACKSGLAHVRHSLAAGRLPQEGGHWGPAVYPRVVFPQMCSEC